MKPKLALMGLVLLLAFPVLAQESYEARFERAWSLVAERYWDPAYNGVDWQGLKPRYRAEVEQVADDRAFYELLDEMYGELADDHSRYLSPAEVRSFRQNYGDLPCFGVFAFSDALRTVGRVEYEMLAGDIGYIKLPDLVGTSGDLRTAVRDLAPRAEAFILDLRGNPGGQNPDMILAAGIFTSGFLWRVLVRWSLPFPQPAIGKVETDAPLVILIDGEVNSAAEGLAGALQNKGRATIVGERSAGNVEAVLPFCLRDGSMALIASGVLAPLVGPTWEGRGVEPDIASKAERALDAALEYLQSRP